jgi:branched-chain amino acid transport system ATP-binding protein
MAPDPLLRLDGVSVRFGGLAALSGVGLRVEAGEVVAVIGPNGAGKTSLFNVITGYVHAVSGTIAFQGRPIHGMTAHAIAARGLRRTFQNGGLFGALTVLENVMAGFHAEIAGGPLAQLLALPFARRAERAAVARAHETLAALGIGHLAPRPAGELSGGQQRMVEIARAVVSHPALLLLDEPAVGLSPTARDTLATTVRRLAQEGFGVLLIEHAIELVMSVSDRIIVLADGSVIADGTPQSVREDEAVLKAYLGHA